MMKKLVPINLTPHDIVIVLEGGNVVIPPSGKTFRLNEEVVKVERFEFVIDEQTFTIPVAFKKLVPPQELEGALTEGAIVSLPSLMMLPPEVRQRIFAPDTGNDSVLRDENGRIYGVRRLCTLL